LRGCAEPSTILRDDDDPLSAEATTTAITFARGTWAPIVKFGRLNLDYEKKAGSAFTYRKGGEASMSIEFPLIGPTRFPELGTT
jgi:hypothetical protein